jgi:hypothetical protein
MNRARIGWFISPLFLESTADRNLSVEWAGMWWHPRVSAVYHIDDMEALSV